MTVSRPRLAHDGRPGRWHGFSLWELAVLLGILGVAIVAGFALLRADRAMQIEDQRLAQLVAADRALAGFIAENGRLPCPDTTGSGVENCSGTAQKGWLPVVTLGLTASAPARGVARLNYIVYRGAGADLTVLAGDRYNPFRFTSWLDLTTYVNLFIPPGIPIPEFDRSTTHAFNQANTLDFCASLTLASNATAGTGASAASAHIPGASGAIVNVAYALAESGIDVDGNSNLFDGLNTSTAPMLESPARASDTDYDDIVQARSFYALGDALKCPQATRSVDAVSHAVEVGVTVTDFQISNTINAGVLSLNANIGAAMNIAALALTVGTVIEGAAVLAKATAALSADTAACAACVVGVGCPACALIPIDTAAIVLATAGLVVGAASIAFSTVVGVPLDIIAYSAALIATAKAGVILAVHPVYPPDMLTELQTAATDAANRASAAEADAIAARATANAALTSYNNNVTSLYNTAHTYDPGGSHDAELAAALAAYQTYGQAGIAYDKALGDAQAKRSEATDADIEADKAEAAAAADPTDVNKQATAASLRARATALDAAATQLEQDALVKQTTMNTAYANYLTARDTALNAYPAAGRADISAALDIAVQSYYAPGANDNYLYKDMLATNLESAAVTARANATALQKAYDDLVAATSGGSTATGGPKLSFPGAEALDILRRVDEKGALQ